MSTLQPKQLDMRTAASSTHSQSTPAPGQSKAARRRRRAAQRKELSVEDARNDTRITESEGSAPISFGSTAKIGTPITTAMPNGDIRIRHREFISDTPGSVNFGVAGFPINPGIAQTFPWLSNIAQNFDKYKFNALSFKYEPSCSTTTAGAVVLAPDYDATDPAPVSKQVMLTFEDAVRGSPWMEIDMRSSKENLNALPQYYIRTGGLPPNADVKTYDTGNMWVSLSGQGTNQTIGELWVDYDVTLITPGLPGTNGLSGKIVGGNTTNMQILGSTPAVSGNLNVVVNPALSPSAILFNAAYQGLVEVNFTGGGIVNLNTGASTAAVAALAAVTLAAGTSTIQVFSVNASQGQTMVFDASGSTSVSSSVVRVAQYSTANA